MAAGFGLRRSPCAFWGCRLLDALGNDPPAGLRRTPSTAAEDSRTRKRPAPVTLAQALFDAREERSPAALAGLIAKLRVYSISDQDDAGPWMRREFPDLFYIVSPSRPDSGDYHRATWSGISGDLHYRNGPFHHFDLVDNPWLEENVIRNHGPLGALYPLTIYIMEGDTPSFLGLIPSGVPGASSAKLRSRMVSGPSPRA